MMKLKGKSALVTGASRGIGRAIVLEFAREGADVGINYVHDHAQAKRTVDEARHYGVKAVQMLSDMYYPELINLMISEFIATFGKIDILVNNAGVLERANFFDVNEALYDKVIGTNLKSAFFASQYAGKFMKEQKSGKILNISSAGGINAQFPNGIEYAVSKAGMIHLTKCLAGCLAPYNVNVNCIAPGYTSTDMTGYVTNPQKRAERERTIALGRVNEPEDIAKLALFLASEDARNITGEVFPIQGGRHLHTGKYLINSI
jgi:3-oxoacyl-[acyl-carrier protein] reductase